MSDLKDIIEQFNTIGKDGIEPSMRRIGKLCAALAAAVAEQGKELAELRAVIAAPEKPEKKAEPEAEKKDGKGEKK